MRIGAASDPAFQGFSQGLIATICQGLDSAMTGTKELHPMESDTKGMSAGGSRAAFLWLSWRGQQNAAVKA